MRLVGPIDCLETITFIKSERDSCTRICDQLIGFIYRTPSVIVVSYYSIICIMFAFPIERSPTSDLENK